MLGFCKVLYIYLVKELQEKNPIFFLHGSEVNGLYYAVLLFFKEMLINKLC